MTVSHLAYWCSQNSKGYDSDAHDIEKTGQDEPNKIHPYTGMRAPKPDTKILLSDTQQIKHTSVTQTINIANQLSLQ